jgi:hypothetical protein
VNRRGRQTETHDDRCTLVLVPRMRSGTGSAVVTAWNAIVLRATSEGFSVLGERVVQATPTETHLPGWLASWRPAHAVIVLPPSSTVCRMCPLPRAKGDQLLSALRLQSETAFMGGIPTHRLSMAALPELPRDDDAAGLQGVILGWPESAGQPPIPALPEGIEVSYTPTLACLLSLLRGVPPTEPLIRADRADGTVLLLLSGMNGIVIRSTLEANDDETTWRESVLRTVAETLLSNDATPEEIGTLRRQVEDRLSASGGDQTAFLALPTAAREMVVRRLPGSSGASALDPDRAMALGAVLLSSSIAGAPNPLVGLGGMRATLPRPKQQPIQRILERLQSPRVAAWTVAASVAAFVFAPLVFAGARYGILSLKVDDLAAYEGANQMTRQKAALYGTLAKSTWPMTKLLGDLSNAMPDTIEVESIQVNAGQGITVRGTAKPTEKPTKMSGKEVVLAFESRARETGIFNEFQYDIDAEDGRGQCTFTIVFNVKDATKVHAWKDEDDNAKTTRRDRLYPGWQEIEKGRGGAAGSALAASDPDDEAEASSEETAAPAAAPATRPKPPTAVASADRNAARREAAAETEGESDPTEVKELAGAGIEPPTEGGEAEASTPGARSDRGINRRPRPESGSEGGSRPSTPQPVAGPKVEIPAPFTDDELKAMSKDAAKDLLAKIAAARQSPSIDPETSERLKADFQRVLQRLKSN